MGTFANIIGYAIFGLIILITLGWCLRIIDKLSRANKIKFALLKSIVIGLVIPIFAVWLWFNSYENDSFDEYALITKSKTTTGFITNAEEHKEEVETNGGRSSGIKYSFSYEYTFRLQNGTTINSNGVYEGSHLPEDMQDLANKPYKVDVQYLPDNPQVNRVKDFLWHNTTVYEWFRFNILVGLIILIVCSYFGFAIIKEGVNKYLMQRKEIASNIQ